MRGLYVTGQFISTMTLVVFAGAFGIVAARRDKFTTFLAALVHSLFPYSIYVARDAWERCGSRNPLLSLHHPLLLLPPPARLSPSRRGAAG